VASINPLGHTRLNAFVNRAFTYPSPSTPGAAATSRSPAPRSPIGSPSSPPPPPAARSHHRGGARRGRWPQKPAARQHPDGKSGFISSSSRQDETKSHQPAARGLCVTRRVITSSRLPTTSPRLRDSDDAESPFHGVQKTTTDLVWF
jgi:hypothetical protein